MYSCFPHLHLPLSLSPSHQGCTEKPRQPCEERGKTKICFERNYTYLPLNGHVKPHLFQLTVAADVGSDDYGAFWILEVIYLVKMVNGLHLCSVFLIFWSPKALFNIGQHSSIHTNINTLVAGDFYTQCRHEITHTHSHTNDTAIRSSLKLSIFPKDTQTCRAEESHITTDLLISRWPAPIPELQPTCCYMFWGKLK